MAPRYEPFAVDVEGHTDDDPISTAKFPSNWELSAARATAVVRFFIEQGMAGDKMKASGLRRHPAESSQPNHRRSADSRKSGGQPPGDRPRHPMSMEERDAYFDRRSREAIAAGGFAAGRAERPPPPPRLRHRPQAKARRRQKPRAGGHTREVQSSTMTVMASRAAKAPGHSVRA